MKKILLALLIGLCSLSSYASWFDRDEITIPPEYINNIGKTYLMEKAARIFGKEYRLTLTNIRLSEYWFICDIEIDDFDHDASRFEVTQHCDDEYDQSHSAGPGTTSTITWYNKPYYFVVHSEVRLQRSDEQKDITVTYHFTNVTSTSGDYLNDDYYLILTFPYNDDRVPTAIDGVEVRECTAVEYYDLQGRKLNAPQPGIVIEKQGNKVTKKLYR